MGYWGLGYSLLCISIAIAFHHLNELNQINSTKQDKEIKQTSHLITFEAKSKHQVKLDPDKDETNPLSLLIHSPHTRENHLLARRAPAALLFPPSTGQDWANKRVSGSDGGDGHRRPLRDALLSALIVAMIIICGRNCREAVRAYLQLSQKRTRSN